MLGENRMLNVGLAIMAVLSSAASSVGGLAANDHCALQQSTQSTDHVCVCVCVCVCLEGELGISA